MLLLLPRLAGAEPGTVIVFLLSVFTAVLLGMTLHEFAHNYVGHLMGDPVPARQGRLTLNPMVHINLWGFMMFVVIGFGPLGSAPISPYRMRNPRWGYMLAVAAGPFSNLLIAIIFAIVIRILGLNVFDGLLYLFLSTVVVYNVLLFIFNLLPFYPIDGWHIVLALLPPDLATQWERNAQTTQMIFFGMLLLSFVPILPIDPLNLIIGEPLSLILNLLGI